LKGGGIEVIASVAPSMEEARHRDLLDRIEKWSANEDNRAELDIWAEELEMSAPFWLSTARVSELEDFIETFEIP
jgi:hypothetical protein